MFIFHKILVLMLLSYIARLLAATNTKNEKRTKLVDSLSLIPPHFGANGREDFFDFDNHFLIKTKTRRDHTQLGYRAQNSFGIVKTKESFKFKDIETNIEFTLHDVSKGGKNSGFGFWLIENPENSLDYYGVNRNFKGCGVIIDIEGTPYAKFVDNSNSTRKTISLRAPENENFKIQFSNQNKKFIVKLFISDKENILYEGPVTLPEKVNIAITSFSGSSQSTLRLERIFSQSFLPGPKKKTVRGERKGKNGFIYFIGACSIIGLAYYLYSKERKEFILKN